MAQMQNLVQKPVQEKNKKFAPMQKSVQIRMQKAAQFFVQRRLQSDVQKPICRGG
jgi:hypothetical protein